MSRDLALLYPDLKTKYDELIVEAEKVGVKFKCTYTGRTLDEQTALYAQGRKPIAKVNALRKQAGMDPITALQNKGAVTWAMASKHLIKVDGFCRAFDVAIIDDNGKVSWDAKLDSNHNMAWDYRELARIGNSIGLTCGFFFKNVDASHFQLGE